MVRGHGGQSGGSQCGPGVNGQDIVLFGLCLYIDGARNIPSTEVLWPFRSRSESRWFLVGNTTFKDDVVRRFVDQRLEVGDGDTALYLVNQVPDDV